MRTCFTRRNFGRRIRFIFLQHNGKRTLVLSDLEIDRGRKQAKADEFVMFSELEREVQGKSKKAPPYEKVLAHFLTKRGVRFAIVPANFPLGYADGTRGEQDPCAHDERTVLAAAGSKIGQGNRADGAGFADHGAGLERAMEVLKASKPVPGNELRWCGQNSDLGNSARRNRFRDFARGRHAGRTRSSPAATRRATRTSAASGRSTPIH